MFDASIQSGIQQNVKQWFETGIYQDPETDKFANDEVLNFLKALHTHCNTWPDGKIRWHVGRANDKNFLQGIGPFPVCLETHRFCTQRITDRDPKVTRPISVDLYMEEMAPIRWVDWDSRVLKRSNLRGRTNTNIRHLNLWIKTAIENGHIYDAAEIMDSEEESVPGKGLVAPPKALTPINTSAVDFPSLKSLNLEVEKPHHCLSIDWVCQTSDDGKKWKEIKIPATAIDNVGGKKTIAITGSHIDGAMYLKIQAVFTNGIGPSISEWLEFRHPSIS